MGKYNGMGVIEVYEGIIRLSEVEHKIEKFLRQNKGKNISKSKWVNFIMKIIFGQKGK